jgi:hypothetical protein
MKINLLFAALALAVPAAAQAETTILSLSSLQSGGNYYTDNLGQVMVTTGGGHDANVGLPSGKNDDGFRGAIDLGFNFTLFGSTYSSLFINNNGNVSFGSGISGYIPEGPTGANAPVISPWFGDVDTRGSLSDVVYYSLDNVGEAVITWNNVGSFSGNDNALNSFQLVLRGDDYAVPEGQGQIGFFYKNMDWIATDSGELAAVGFGDGAGNAVVLEGSNAQANLNDVLENKFVWFNENLQPVPPAVPEPATWAMMILGLGAIGTMARGRRRKLAFA